MEWFLIFCAFVFGMGVGAAIERRIWAGNADKIQRIHFNNNLYKVHRENN
jgi:hypothetical protein